MKQSLDQLPCVYRLGDKTKEYLQVILKEFILKKSDKGIEIKINFSDDDLCIRKSQDKQILHQWINKHYEAYGRKFTNKLNQFEQNENMLAYHFICEQFPFRHSNGGVLPIIRLDKKEYFCLFYRDVAPSGWNIANGGSGNIDELLHPKKVLFREFSEELIIVDDEKEHLYQFDSFEKGLQYGMEKEALRKWGERRGKNYDLYTNLSIPIKWVEGPDKMFIEYNQESYISDGCFLSITPKDNAIEMDKIALMSLKNISLLDGELICSEKKNNRKCQLLNRIIGLFQIDRFSEKLDQKEYIPDYIYFNGKKESKEKIDTCINQYLEAIKDIRKKQNIQPLTGPPYPKNLCPITQKIIKRYLQLLIEEKKDSENNIQYIQERMRVAKEDFKIFISYKSEDRQMANALYQFLNCEKEGLSNKVFFSSESIMQVGESDYAQIIDQALEKANCLIVVGSKPEFFNSGWVGYEWRSFLNEIRSNRKKNGQVFTFTDEVSLDQLPYGLRSVQNIPYNPASPQDSFEKLFIYLKNVI